MNKKKRISQKEVESTAKEMLQVANNVTRSRRPWEDQEQPFKNAWLALAHWHLRKMAGV